MITDFELKRNLLKNDVFKQFECLFSVRVLVMSIAPNTFHPNREKGGAQIYSPDPLLSARVRAAVTSRLYAGPWRIQNFVKLAPDSVQWRKEAEAPRNAPYFSSTPLIFFPIHFLPLSLLRFRSRDFHGRVRYLRLLYYPLVAATSRASPSVNISLCSSFSGAPQPNLPAPVLDCFSFVRNVPASVRSRDIWGRFRRTEGYSVRFSLLLSFQRLLDRICWYQN